ncbi:MAG: hypothetical protein K1X65_08175 [Caldilineales bacterium]|nr:hypothetical protein [Caldilineales bacterium]MCW5859978.1 hypothetical protein [Caldilineales bacterium]
MTLTEVDFQLPRPETGKNGACASMLHASLPQAMSLAESIAASRHQAVR